MNRTRTILLLLAGVFAVAGRCLAAVGTLADGAGVVTWGRSLEGQYNNSPTGTFTAIDAGYNHSVGLRTDGTVVTWGQSSDDQYNNSPTGTFTAIDAGYNHSVGLRTDGTVVTWGRSLEGQYNNSPTGTFTAIDAGLAHSVGLRTDGTVVTWGNNGSGQYNNPPSGTFTAIDAGFYHSVGLRTNGTVVTWGSSGNNAPIGTFTSVDAGAYHSVGLRADGTVVTWGDNSAGQYDNSPAGTFRAIAAGRTHSVGLRSNGTVVTWGGNSDGQYNNSPTGTFTAIAAGYFHSVGLRTDGTVVTWGQDGFGEYINSPTGAFTAIAAGAYHSVGLLARTTYDQGLRVYGTGMTANLNRSVSVTGDMTIEAPLNFYYNPTATVSGNLIVAPGVQSVFGGGTLSVYGGLEIQGGIGQGLALYGQELAVLGGLGGTGMISVNSTSTHMQLGLINQKTSSSLFRLTGGATITATGAGYQSAGALQNGYDYTNLPVFGGDRQVDAGGELRLRPGQQLRFTGTAALPSVPGQNGPAAYASPNFNGGKIELLGNSGATSEIEFLGEVTNAPSTGLVTGRNATMRFSGGLSNRGSLLLTDGVNDVFGNITNVSGGKIAVSGSASATFYDDVVQNGTLQVTGVGSTRASVVFAGNYSGGGATGGGDVIILGDLRPGNSPASVTFANNVALGGAASTNIELAGTTLGSQYDHLTVTGELALGGTLSVSLLSGFAPSAGQSFDILDWGTLSGAFASFSLPTLGGGLGWNTSQLYTTGVLSVAVVGVPGDYNNNGTVDAADYVLWRKGGPLASEVDNPGTINSADYSAWRARFGNTSGSGVSLEGSQVPEPATGLLLGLGLIQFFGRCARKKKLQ